METLTPEKEIADIRLQESENLKIQAFHRKHPFVLSDGRRFATLACAGHSAFEASHVIAGVTDERTKKTFTWHEACRAYQHKNGPEWDEIGAPMGRFFSGLISGAGSYDGVVREEGELTRPNQ